MRGKSRSWEGERASVSSKGSERPRSNKYSHSDSHSRPATRSRQRIWVGGYVRDDGTSVAGHYRATAGR